MCVWDSEELVDGEPSLVAPSSSAGACHDDNEVESDVTALLLDLGQRASKNELRDLG